MYPEKFEIADEQKERWEREEAIERASTKTLERLHDLVQKGYQPDFERDFVEAIWLHHPSTNFPHNKVTLYPSGLVVTGADPACRIYREDEREFREFLKQIPSPTFWDRTRAFKINTTAWGLIAAAVVGIWLVVEVLSRLFAR
jgi:hypothetical protein